ncbi:relaxase domain-containing protein [Mumia sp. zg.B21]|uniref:MobF family relaxase n=1 Tax=Mumia sp. zg.B21 TaxID=2855447 RepID=UPI001C6E9827|nr:MobF family relaxase [Mumia sp. zg.B21]MBW9211623.1 relaxase domain-containing protein [Mumia sp. zg.B21]
MTLQKLSAGSGYEYLTRQVAALDSTEKGSIPLADYYAAKGEPPGRWVGSGLVGIDGLEPGDIVTAEQMKHLFGAGCDPVSGRPLGSAYKVYTNETVDAFNARVGELLSHKLAPTHAERAAARATAAAEFFVAENGREAATARELSAAVARYSRPRQTAVAGFDLTFSPVKSVSALWAVATPEVASKIEEAHHAAVADAIAFIEDHALFTREGKDGARQVETRGLIAAAFTHRDSRAGDPDLHTHVAVANKVQTKQGKWLSIYGRVLHQHVVAASETYNTALERHLVEALGVQFADRPGIDREKRPIREIVGVDRELCEAWSRRRADIVARQRELTRDFRDAHGRTPTPVEAVALAQQANLETREAKHEPRSLADQRATWRGQAVEVLGSPHAVDRMVHAALHPTNTSPPTAVSTSWLREMAERVLGELEAHRATWQSWHAYAEVQRQIRGADLSPELMAIAVSWVVDEVADLTINLTLELDPISEPEGLCRSNGTSVYRHTGRDHFTTTRVLEAEARIIEAAGSTDASAWSTDDVELAILAARLDGTELNAGQEGMVRELATSGRRVQLALAPAGTGKTTTMRVLAGVWTEAGADALGLTPSAAAAAALRDATGMACETLAKLVDDLDARPDSPLAAAIGPGTLLVIDEAGMADTITLDRVISFAIERGATVRLIGDDQQLAAVGAGGVLRDIERTQGAVRLDEVVRFEDPVEAEASLALRDGARSALGYYLDHERIHAGDQQAVVDEVFDAWRREQDAGRDCLMLAPTHELVRELNERARSTRLGDGAADDEVRLRDGTHASVGDVVLTRRNDRRLGVSNTDWVKNGDRWTVTGIRGGTLTVRHRDSGLTTVLPADYVAAHVELGYASTVHTAQGLTADVMHGVITGDETRQLLYTMLTRGRAENHVHVVADDLSDEREFELPDITEQLSVAEILERVLANDGAAVSATTTRQVAGSPEARLRDAATRYADAVAIATQQVLSAGDDEAGPWGPLAWLPHIPAEVADHPRWGPYLTARKRLVSSLAAEVRDRADVTLPAWLDDYDDVLTAELRTDIAVWRAAQGIPADERTVAGPPPDDDRAASYRRRLLSVVNSRYDKTVRVWERRVVQYVGTADENTLDLARELDRLRRQGHDPERLLQSAMASPLPRSTGRQPSRIGSASSSHRDDGAQSRSASSNVAPRPRLPHRASDCD